MKQQPNRRKFLKRSVVATLAAPLITSLEEYTLSAQPGGEEKATPATPSPSKSAMPTGTIGKVKISRLICGGNLISGYAHSRDLIYVSPLLKHYFSDGKILETWELCEQNGINTMIVSPADKRAVALYEKYRAQGGKIQYLAQLNATKDDLVTCVKQSRDVGAVGAFLLGNLSDAWTREGDVGRIGELIGNIKGHGLISGVAAHELRSVKTVEAAKCGPEFYMKTLHSTQYWSTRRPDQMKEVIDNYGIDNYWCKDPQDTIAYMAELERPWIAYKVLAAGAIPPRAGFKHAFDNGADFAAVGIFDFQIAEDAVIACEVVKAAKNRERAWYA
jgi:hypothetical protein